MLAVSFFANAQPLYKWVDKSGKVHYSDQPPPKEIKKVDQPRLGKSSIDTSGLPYEAQKAAQDYPVSLYTTPDCESECKTAREYLSNRGIPFSEQSLSSPQAMDAYKKLFKSDKVQIPAITVGSQQLIGFTEGGWGGLLDTAGYPRTAIPGRKPAAQ
jgi:glutaredoxin